MSAPSRCELLEAIVGAKFNGIGGATLHFSSIKRFTLAISLLIARNSVARSTATSRSLGLATIVPFDAS